MNGIRTFRASSITPSRMISADMVIEDKREAIESAIHHHDAEAEISVEHELEENSPYPEVVAAVRNSDEVDLPANTLRAWVLGMAL
jgi:hypothetical protein